MRHIAIAAPILLVPLLAGGASAADVERFRLEKTPTGYVRMDTKTGEMSLCEEKWGELVCRMAADERTAVQDEIERLQTDVKALEERVATVKALEGRVAALENSLTAKIERTLPTEEEFNKTMSYMERFFRGFIGIVKDLEGENSEPAQPGADRT
jgi:tetrahydromethanopterin S-methyltransferase subunit B